MTVHIFEALTTAALAALAWRASTCTTDPWTPDRWPWERRFWKPTPEDRVRELVKAGALIAAEIDRLQAAAQTAAEVA